MSIIQNAQGFIPAARVSRKPVGIVGFVAAALTARRTRNALAKLDDRALADIGLSRSDAQIEAARPLWDVPAYPAR